MPEIVINKYFAKHTQPSLSPHQSPVCTHCRVITWKAECVSCVLENISVNAGLAGEVGHWNLGKLETNGGRGQQMDTKS